MVEHERGWLQRMMVAGRSGEGAAAAGAGALEVEVLASAAIGCC